jgi:hypothetical protein
VLVRTEARDAKYLVYGIPCREFKPRQKPELLPEQRERFHAWLQLRGALRGASATAEDRAQALRRYIPILQATAKSLSEEEPTGPPVAIFPRGVVGGKGPWAAWETSFRLGDGSLTDRWLKEYSRVDTAQKAHDYLASLMLRDTMLAELKRSPAILCLNSESAHYAGQVLGDEHGICRNKTCLKLFLHRRKDDQYCSDRCRWAARQRDYRAKKRAQRKEK